MALNQIIRQNPSRKTKANDRNHGYSSFFISNMMIEGMEKEEVILFLFDAKYKDSKEPTVFNCNHLFHKTKKKNTNFGIIPPSTI